jgi:hypothetical protein
MTRRRLVEQEQRLEARRRTPAVRPEALEQVVALAGLVRPEAPAARPEALVPLAAAWGAAAVVAVGAWVVVAAVVAVGAWVAVAAVVAVGAWAAVAGVCVVEWAVVIRAEIPAQVQRDRPASRQRLRQSRQWS